MALPWTEANRWSAEGLQRWHQLLKAHGRFSFVQRCKGTQEKWQLGLAINNENRELYLTVIRKNGDFYLQSINTKRPPGCPGETHPWDDDK